eukprot:1482918-Prymnesium_polylepis.1
MSTVLQSIEDSEHSIQVCSGLKADLSSTRACTDCPSASLERLLSGKTKATGAALDASAASKAKEEAKAKEAATKAALVLGKWKMATKTTGLLAELQDAKAKRDRKILGSETAKAEAVSALQVCAPPSCGPGPFGPPTRARLDLLCGRLAGGCRTVARRDEDGDDGAQAADEGDDTARDQTN